MPAGVQAKVYCWQWSFKSPPNALWPLVSNTDRFNRDCGLPPVRVIPVKSDEKGLVTNSRRLRTVVYGLIPIEWDERPFEWEENRRFGVRRTYRAGPVASMVTSCTLEGNPSGGTDMTYEVEITPKGLFGRILVPLGVGYRSRTLFERIFRIYDGYAQRGVELARFSKPPSLAPGGADRLDSGERALLESGQRPALVTRLGAYLRSADDLSVSKIRCYAMADSWKENRTETLSLFLHATRAGVLDFSWDIVCPHCRGAKSSENSLLALKTVGRCDTCNVDFTVDFDRSVELTFTPNAAIRPVIRTDYCVGGPQVTPHVVAQVMVGPHAQRTFVLDLDPGRYRIRMPGSGRLYPFVVDPHGSAAALVELALPLAKELTLAPRSRLTCANESESEYLAIVEHTAWSDQATSAAEVTSLQAFRDLFSREVLRPGEQISVGTMTIVFTDLKNSTAMYRQIGDAPAFGRVLSHFDVLKAAISDNDGAIVKTMGDAVMAVFRDPRRALVAMATARTRLATLRGPGADPFPLELKAGLHAGPCLAISQNEHLDYFGTTVNLSARLCSLCTGNDFVISETLAADPGVSALLLEQSAQISTRQESVRINGFGDSSVAVRRLVLRV